MASANQGWCTVVVPCYNEAGRLKTAEFAEFLAGPAGENIRILFVNDGSSDGTLAMLERFRKSHEAHVQVLDQQPNAGKGEAVRAGLLAALRLGESEFVGFLGCRPGDSTGSDRGAAKGV